MGALLFTLLLGVTVGATVSWRKMDWITGTGVHVVAGAWMGLVVAYLILCPFKHLLGDLIKSILLGLACAGGAKMIHNWGNQIKRCYPVIGAGLFTSAVGFFVGGFPNLFDVTEMYLFDYNGMMPLGYAGYLLLFVAWMFISSALMAKQISETE